MKKVIVIQGPNLNLLGERETEIYGTTKIDEIHGEMTDLAKKLNVEIEFFQSNHEGEIIDYLQQSKDEVDAIIINPGAFTHYSYAIVDAIRTLSRPTVEVHISNIFAREEWRHDSVFSPVVNGIISGLGNYGYLAALSYLVQFHLKS